MNTNYFSRCAESIFNFLLRQIIPSTPSRYIYIKGQRTVIKDILPEIILEIFSTLSIADLVPLRVVDKQWKILIDCSLESVNRSTISKGITLYGKFKNGELNGQGKKNYSNGLILEGEFKDGQLNGKGKATCTNGTRLEGEFKEAPKCLILVTGHTSNFSKS